MGETCQFGRYDAAGNAIEECHRTDYVEVLMYDEDVVRLCPRHRSWAVAMGRPLTQEAP